MAFVEIIFIWHDRVLLELTNTGSRSEYTKPKREHPTLGFSGAARIHASYVAGNTMKEMLSPRPLQAIVMLARLERFIFACSSFDIFQAPSYNLLSMTILSAQQHSRCYSPFLDNRDVLRCPYFDTQGNQFPSSSDLHKPAPPRLREGDLCKTDIPSADSYLQITL